MLNITSLESQKRGTTNGVPRVRSAHRKAWAINLKLAAQVCFCASHDSTPSTDEKCGDVTVGQRHKHDAAKLI
jgi:hypothetical protein